MKKQITLILLFITVNLFGSNLIELSFVASDIAYSVKHNKLYALVDIMNRKYGNRIVEIDVNTGEVKRSLFVGCQPFKIRITSDENYAWISFLEIPFMKRVDLNSFVVDKEVYLGPSQKASSGNKRNSFVFCTNFTILPNENNELAMSLRAAFYKEAIVHYLNDTILPKKLIPEIGYYFFPVCLEPLSGPYLMGYIQSNMDSGFTIMKLEDDGLVVEKLVKGLFSVGPDVRRNWFKVHNDTLYHAGGMIIDATDVSGITVAGKCENDFIDDQYGFIFSDNYDAYAYPNYHNDSVFLTFYDKNTFEPFDSVFLMKYQYQQIMMIIDLIEIRPGMYAILIGKDYGVFKIHIVYAKPLGTEEEQAVRQIKIYPNPASGKIFVKGLPEHKTIDAYDVLGRHVSTWETHELTSEIKIGDLKKGIYLLKISDPDNNSTDFVKKIIVQ